MRTTMRSVRFAQAWLADRQTGWEAHAQALRLCGIANRYWLARHIRETREQARKQARCA